MYHYSYDISSIDSIECELEYFEAEIGSRDCGQQMEPDYPDYIELYSAEINGTDIIDLLSDVTKQMIEQKAMEQMKKEWAEDDGLVP